MTRSHEEMEELLGAYALDAVDRDEALDLAAHIPDCPKCSAELAAHREVTSLFAYTGQQAPEGLWDRITASMQEKPPELRLDRIRASMAKPPEASRPADSDAPGEVIPLRSSSKLRSVPYWRPLMAVAAAVAVIVAVAGVEVGLHQRQTTSSYSAVAVPTMQNVDAALASRGSRKIVLTSSDAKAALKAVITPSGTGYIYDSNLTPLTADRTYQLWGMVGHARISYGLLGTNPSIVEFTAAPDVSALAVTNEVASGVVVTHEPLVAAGAVRSSV